MSLLIRGDIVNYVNEIINVLFLKLNVIEVIIVGGCIVGIVVLNFGIFFVVCLLKR